MTQEPSTKDQGTGSSERRTARRFPLGWQAKIKGLDATGSSFEEFSTVTNLSSTGVFLHVSRQVRVGTELDILIRVPFQQEHWMRYPGRVIRVEPTEPQAGVAIRFSTLKPKFV
jgi:hypothetical protein